MGAIRVLSDDLISLISAGEVIENPSSIVKELIENSLDAGASHIDIAITSGGIGSIIVSDNGQGILKVDCPVCTLRYSTSKVSTKEDIESILTYGFRGEALASIATVADLTISTKHREEEVGTRITSRAGEIPAIEDASRPDGTTVEVTNLFMRVPARRTHLSEPRIESQRVLDVAMRHAILRNDIGFRLVRDGRVAIDCPPAQTPRDRVLHLWGPDIAANLVEFQHISGEVRVSGFVALPPASRGNRSREYFSVRKRPIQDSRLNLAVEQAYSTLLMRGRFPICAVNIDMDAAKVDAIEAVKQLTSGRGADYVFVAVGSAAAIEQGFAMSGPRGTTVIIGLPEIDKNISMPPFAFLRPEKVLMGSFMGTVNLSVDIPKLVELYQAGKLKLDELITGHYSLEQINEAIESVERGEALRNVNVLILFYPFLIRRQMFREKVFTGKR